jgi:nickel/cobalt transporter (NicO) family protein
VSGFDSRLLDAFDEAALDYALWPIAIGVALLVGAAHALRPGHGKTLVAAYLVAERGRWMHAVALAVIVAGLHTVSVLVIGLVWWAVAGERAGSIEPVAMWARLAAALLVLGVGAAVLRRQWRRFRRWGIAAGRQRERGLRQGHEHAFGIGRGQDPDRGFGNEHGREPDRETERGAVAVEAIGHSDASAEHHTHDHHHGPPAGVEPWSWAGLIGIASAGALVPSPAAFLILVSGLLTGQAALAVVMVACFGIGLAVTVLAVGLMVIAGRDWVGRKAKAHRPLARLGAWAPLLGAAVVVCGGLALSAMAVAALAAS